MFRNNSYPSYKPWHITNDRLHTLLNHFCGDLSFENCSYKGYKLNLARITKQIECSSSYREENCFSEVEENIDFIKDCPTKDAYNTLGVFYALGKGVEADITKAIEFFNMANNKMSHFNLASLMSCGAKKSVNSDIMFHLGFCKDFPSEKIDLVKSNIAENFAQVDIEENECDLPF